MIGKLLIQIGVKIYMLKWIRIGKSNDNKPIWTQHDFSPFEGHLCHWHIKCKSSETDNL